MRREHVRRHLDVDTTLSAGASPRLYGRERELDLLDRLLDVGQRGKSLVVRGDAGIGKSAVLAELSRRAGDRGFRTVMATGVGLEADLPFAGLHALLAPTIDRFDRLPGRLREAISAAFGLNGDSAPDRFLIALAALELLTEMAADAPVLVIVEDAQWLDTESADVLAFLSRRLGVEPVATVLAVRDGIATRFDQLGRGAPRLDALRSEDAGGLLDGGAPALAFDARARLLDAAAGNPLALIELPRAIRDDDRAGRLPPGPLPLTDRLQNTFNARADELPRRTHVLLLVAALNDSGAVSEIVAAARLLSDDVGEEHLAPAVAAGLLRSHGTQIEFRHPLVRSALYEAATSEQRRAANAALAETLASDPDRSVWHRAAAAERPDEAVVQMLEATAERARRRGAAAAAVAAFERAARLTAAEASQGAYLIRAAHVALSLGRPHVVLRLLREAEPLDLEPADRTWLLWHLEQFEPRWTGATKVPALVDMAKQLSRGGDDVRALEVLDDVAFRCWWGNPPPETRKLVVDVAESLELPPSTPALLSVLGLADPVGQGARVIERLSRSLSAPDRDPWESQELGVAGAAVWADDFAVQFLADAASGARAQGRLGLLAQVLVSQAWAALNLGRWETASTSAAEAASLASETSQLRWLVVARLGEGMVAASKGDTAAVEEILEECEQPLLAYGANPLLALVQLVRGRSLVAAGRHIDAYHELRRILEPTEPAYQPLAGVWAIVDLAEAAAQAGTAREARALLEPLEEFGAHSPGAFLCASLRFARAVLARADELEHR